MKKLLYVTNRTSGPGGLERVLSIKASLFADNKDFEVHIVTLNQGVEENFYSFSEAIVFHDIKTSNSPLAYINDYIFGLRNTIRVIDPDVISVCDDGLKGFFVPLIIGKPCAMVYERHVSKNIEIKTNSTSLKQKISTQIKFKLMNFGSRFYDKFIVLTKGNLEEWNIKNIAVIPNPLSFYPEKVSTLKNKKVLAVGKQSFQKGYDRLLRSWKLVNDQHPDWVLDIYGTISEKENLEGLARDLDISKSVNFYKPVKDIASKYLEASIYTMSSRFEGFGMVLTEAMAYGVPCVSFDCPHGPSDIISDNENGLLIENDNIESFAKGIIRLIKNDVERKEMGLNARKEVKRYLPETINDQWIMLFETIISANK